MFRHKAKASLIHLALSIALVGLVVASLLFFFFPKIFINVSDFKEIATIIISVDLILGPILTFVVFQPNKKSLKFDLSVIASVQLAALVYGAYALFQVHPVYITFNVDRFTMVNARDANPEKSKYEEYKVSKLSTAKLAFAKMPNEQSKRIEITLAAAQGKDLDQWTEYYEPYEKNRDQILSKALNHQLLHNAADSDKEVFNFLEKHRAQLNNYAFFPLNTANKDAIIVLDKKSAQPIATINSDPWKLAQK